MNLQRNELYEAYSKVDRYIWLLECLGLMVYISSRDNEYIQIHMSQRKHLKILEDIMGYWI